MLEEYSNSFIIAAVGKYSFLLLPSLLKTSIFYICLLYVYMTRDTKEREIPESISDISISLFRDSEILPLSLRNKEGSTEYFGNSGRFDRLIRMPS